MGDTTTELPKYKCHKEVHAVKIAKIESDWNRRTREGQNVSEATSDYWITPAEEGFEPIKLSPFFIRKHDPKVGGYLVIYEDGYRSYSPAKAFEDGYTRVE